MDKFEIISKFSKYKLIVSLLSLTFITEIFIASFVVNSNDKMVKLFKL